MKILGYLFIIFAILNLIVALLALTSNAPSETVLMKFNAFILLTVLGAGLLYFGNKKKK